MHWNQFWDKKFFVPRPEFFWDLAWKWTIGSIFRLSPRGSFWPRHQKNFFVPKWFSGHFQMVLSKSLILRFFCRFVGKNVAKFLCYIDLLKVTKLTRLTCAQLWRQLETQFQKVKITIRFDMVNLPRGFWQGTMNFWL